MTTLRARNFLRSHRIYMKQTLSCSARRILQLCRLHYISILSRSTCVFSSADPPARCQNRGYKMTTLRARNFVHSHRINMKQTLSCSARRILQLCRLHCISILSRSTCVFSSADPPARCLNRGKIILYNAYAKSSSIIGNQWILYVSRMLNYTRSALKLQI